MHTPKVNKYSAMQRDCNNLIKNNSLINKIICNVKLNIRDI